ncbi:DUF5337 domain-containing protein [Primorskyibacter sp. S187A]|uniref:DUF5337 domain-containing protein n=1 Tax=Primorskyibacter sp. S187A TaxID=3415130 RepID=UPI003C7CC2A7
MSREKDTEIAKQGRVTALVIAGSMLIWIAAQALGPALGLPGRYALLVDFLVLAALFWAMVNIFQIWRKRRNSQG